MSRGVSRRSGLALARAAVWVVLAALVVPGRTPAPRDVILVSIDTLRADHLGCYGYPRPTSPELDAFAARSVRFSRAVAHAPNTLPSHIALLTSRIPGSFARVDGEAPLPLSARTLAEVLGEHGFATWGFTDGGYLRRSFGLAQGFEHYDDQRTGLARLRLRVAKWLDQHASDSRPMFLFIHTYEVHSPYAPPTRYRGLFLDPDDASDFEPSTENLVSVVERKRTLAEGDLDRIVALYDAGIRHADDQLARLFGDLENRGRFRNAIVIVTSDHGEEFMEHGSLLHWRLFFRPNLHVPLIVRVPGTAARVVEDVVGLIDVVPSVLDLLGLPPLRTATGRSLRPLIEGRSLPERPVYSEPFSTSLTERSLVTATAQILQRPNERRLRLFDLEADPYSTRNVWRSRRRLAANLSAQLAARRAEVEAPRPRKGPDRAKGTHITPGLRRELKALGYAD